MISAIDVTDCDVVALVIGREQTLAFGDDQDLIARVDVRLVHRTLLEMHFGKPQIAALLADGRLVVDLPDEDRVVRPLSSGLRDAYHPHTSILAQTGTK